MKEGKTPEEDILGLLDRLTEDYTKAGSLEEVRNMLKEELGYDRPTLAEAIWSGVGTKVSMSEMGIRGVWVHYKPPRDYEHRYGIQGMPGLWSWQSVQEIMAGELGFW